MQRLLLFASIAGFLLTLWSFVTAVDRPIPFDLLRNALDQAAADGEFSPDDGELIEFRVGELERAYLAHVHRRDTALVISWAGLFLVSSSSLACYVLHRK